MGELIIIITITIIMIIYPRGSCHRGVFQGGPANDNLNYCYRRGLLLEEVLRFKVGWA